MDPKKKKVYGFRFSYNYNPGILIVLTDTFPKFSFHTTNYVFLKIFYVSLMGQNRPKCIMRREEGN